MKISYGVTSAGIPVRIKHTRLFKQPVLKKEYAIQRECEICNEKFWKWPEAYDHLCARCQYQHSFTLKKLEA